MTPFDPLVADWFRRTVGEPTALQERAWQAAAAGEHALIVAPTGSGKTLAAFLWALDRLATGAWPCGATRVLYVSPLRALANDIRENLQVPLEGLRSAFTASARAWPEPRVEVRSGDTPASERRRQLRRPAEIFITTPESLAILLGTEAGRRIFGGLRLVILDEIHAAADSRRGALLMASVERLTLLAGEVQRIALSATVKPLDAMARFVGGFLPDGTPRRVSTICDTSTKEVRLSVEVAPPGAKGFWEALAERLRPSIETHRSTLVFVNSRRAAERLARALNESAGRPIAYAHHGSLSRELREAVERRMKAGELPVIVATSSLELGIDIGALDEVILVQTPPSIASALQRIGRAGHRIGAVSRARIYPLPGRDLVDAAALCSAVRDRDIEEVRFPRTPLDVLAQVVLSLCAVEPWDPTDLYAFLRRVTAFRDLTESDYTAVLAMLQGRVGERRVRALPVRLRVDPETGRLVAASGSALLLRLSGGTIPDRGLYALHLAESGATVGELDEEFVWERKVGDTFSLGTRSWRIVRIDEQQVVVTPSKAPAAMAPFWRGDVTGRSFHLAERMGLLLETIEAARDDLARRSELEAHADCSPEAAEALLALLARQREVSGCPLPHRHHIVVEHVLEPEGSGRATVIHTLWGGRVNRTFALVLEEALERELGIHASIWHDDAGVLIAADARAGWLDRRFLVRLAATARIQAVLTRRLPASGIFGARFREAAQVALVLPRPGGRRRMPLWLNRLRAKRLMNAVRGSSAFPLVLEALRTCLEQDCDPWTLAQLFAEIAEGAISVSETGTSAASPFAAGLLWQRTGSYMYADDAPEAPLEPSAYHTLLADPSLAASVEPELAADFQRRLQRIAPGYAPRDAKELASWAAERLLQPMAEWRRLLEACSEGGAGPPRELQRSAARYLVRVSLGVHSFVAARRTLPRILRVLQPRGTEEPSAIRPRVLPLEGDSEGANEAPGGTSIASRSSGQPVSTVDPQRASEEEFLAFLEEWLGFYGPVEPELLAPLAACRGLDTERLAALLAERGSVAFGRFLRGSSRVLLCDRGNLERLLSLAAARARLGRPLRPAALLPLFVAAVQGLARSDAEATGAESPERSGGSRGAPQPAPSSHAEQKLVGALDPLLGYPLPVRMWESLVFPARLPDYQPAWLDELLRETELIWFGAGKGRVGFSLRGERGLWLRSEGGPQDLFPDERAAYAFWDLAERTGLASGELARRLWDLAWRGLVTTDSFAALRRALAEGFEAAQPTSHGQSGRRPHSLLARRLGFQRWLASRPLDGRWSALQAVPEPSDALEDAERVDAMIYQLLDRYGILFPALLRWELPHVRWARLFRRLRVLELAGEVVGGAFFEGVDGPQFLSPRGLELLEEGLPELAVYWASAADPASLAGIRVEGLGLPPRRSSTLLVYSGWQCVLAALRFGADVRVFTGPRDEGFARAVGVLVSLVERDVAPRKLLRLERINGDDAASSSYRGPLLEAGFRREGSALVLRQELLRNRT